MSGLELADEVTAPQAVQANQDGENVKIPWKNVNKGVMTHDITLQFRDATASTCQCPVKASS